MSVMVLQGRKSSPQKSRPPESGHRRHGVWIAIEYSYKLGQKKEFKFLCVPGWFLQIQSQVFNAIERYEKRYGFVHVLSDVLKPTMSIDAPGTIRRTVEWSIPLEKSLSTN